MQVRFRPLSTWPGERTPPCDRQSSPFKASWGSTLALIERELAFLGASEVVIEAGFTEQQIRLDGWPRGDAATPSDPGVIISFETKKYGPLRYSCDQFTKTWGHDLPGWQANLRAIALGLEALRKVERYGIASRGEQYAGWKQLGTGIPMGAVGESMTPDQAAEVLCEAAGIPHEHRLFSDPAMIDKAWKKAVRLVHPDVGGDPDEFRRVQRAREILTAVA